MRLVWTLVAVTALAMPVCAPAAAETFSAKDVQIVVKAMGFLDPAPAGGVVAVVSVGSDAASKADAQAIVALFGPGIAGRNGMITAKVVDQAALGGAAGYIAIITASGVQGDAVLAAANARRIPCITVSLPMVQSGQCTMGVKSDPKVEITVNRDAAQHASVAFVAAFRMLIHEL